MAFECPKCGGSLLYNINRGKLKCEHCDSEIPVKDYDLKNGAQETTDEYGVTSYVCRNCGAELLSPDNSIVSYCSYCGGEATLEGRMTSEVRPQFIIPFKQRKSQCKEAYKNKLSKMLYLPNELKDPEYLERFRGTYIPYWMYKVDFPEEIKINATEKRRSGKYYIESTYDVGATVDGEYLGIPYDASSCFDDTIADTLMPFNKKDLKEFYPGYMAGFYADRADVPVERYSADVTRSASAAAFKELSHQMKKNDDLLASSQGDEANEYAMKPRIGNYFAALFPVWFLTYRKKDRVAYAIVNGQNGRVSSDLPVDLKKYAIGAAGITAIIFLILTLLVSMTARMALALCAFMALAVSALFVSETVSIRNAENHVKDRGYFVRGRDVSMSYEARKRARESTGKGRKSVIIIFYTILTIMFVVMSLFLGIGIASSAHTNPAIKLLVASSFAVLPSAVLFIKGMRVIRYVEEKSLAVYNLMPFLGTLCAFMVAVWNPVDDIYYYTASIFCAFCAAVASVGMITHYNLIATRPIPNFFDREGGNDKPERERDDTDPASATSGIKTFAIILLSMLILGGSMFGNAVRVYAEDRYYTNPETGYKAFIIDEEDLLTEAEEVLLIEEMRPLTEFGNIGFITCYAVETSTRLEVEKRYVETIGGGVSGSILLVDMNYRIIQIASDGDMYKVITKGQANAITDNSYKYASRGDFYGCAKDIFAQELQLMKGGRVPQPMKHISNFLVALTLGILINYILVVFQRGNSTEKEEKIFTATTASTLIPTVNYAHKVSERRYRVSEGGSGGGGGFSGGGGGGFSGGGGGGFSGGGGGHSF